MTGKELVDYLVLSGKINYDKEYTTKGYLGKLRNCNEEVGVRYKIFLNYFGDIYNIYKIIDKFTKLIVDIELNNEELIKLIDNIKFLASIEVYKKDIALNTFMGSLDSAERNKKAKINEFTIPIGTKHYYNLKTLDKRISYQLNYADRDKVCIGKMVDYDCVEEENHVKYIMYDFKNNIYDIVRNPDFNNNRNFYKQRDKNRLKLKFVKYI